MNASQPTACGGVDHLTRLPAELLHLIFSYLLPTHSPDRAIFDAKKEKPCSHELDHVAATNKRLRSEVNEWALHFLISHKDVTKCLQTKSSAKKNRTVTINHLRGRAGVLTWCSSHCVFCGKKSFRSAILVNGFRCCAACDKAQWDKITLTDAKKIYGLKEENLLPDKHVNSPTSRKLMAQLGLPRARYGVYTCQGAKATMFLLEDVKQLAALVHGELESYMAKREAARVARNLKVENKKQDAAVTKPKPSISFSSGTVQPTGLEFEHLDTSSSMHLGEFQSSDFVEFLDDREQNVIIID